PDILSRCFTATAPPDIYTLSLHDALPPDRLAPRRTAAFRAAGAHSPGGRRRYRTLPDMDRGALRGTGTGAQLGTLIRPCRTHLQTPLPKRDRHVAAGIRAYPSSRGGKADAGGGR